MNIFDMGLFGVRFCTVNTLYNEISRVLQDFTKMYNKVMFKTKVNLKFTSNNLVVICHCTLKLEYNIGL